MITSPTSARRSEESEQSSPFARKPTAHAVTSPGVAEVLVLESPAHPGQLQNRAARTVAAERTDDGEV